MDPNGCVVIITGASSGIGAATARLFAAYGATVVLAARSHEALERVAADLAGQSLVVPTDMADSVQVEALVQQTLARHGRVDILINNAGVGLTGPVADLRAADLQQTLAVDVLGPIAAIQAVVPPMRRQGRGQIINISSVLAAQPLPYLGGYAAAKAALERVSEALRMELRGSGIAVSVVRPGTTQTDFNARRLGSGSERRRFKARGVPPAAVAQAILRTARQEPRIAYVSLSDRLALVFAAALPILSERLLAESIRWEEH
jgi:short-subunit dehydrogenase